MARVSTNMERTFTNLRNATANKMMNHIKPVIWNRVWGATCGMVTEQNMHGVILPVNSGIILKLNELAP